MNTTLLILFCIVGAVHQKSVLANIHVSGFNTGIYLDEVWNNIEISSSKLDLGNHGIYANGGGNMSIFNCEVMFQMKNGITFYYFRGNVHVSGTKCFNITQTALSVRYSYHENENISLTLTDSMLWKNSVGFQFYKADYRRKGNADFIVKSNSFQENDDAILSSLYSDTDSVGYMVNLTLLNNTLVNNTRGLTYHKHNRIQWFTWQIENNTFVSLREKVLKIHGIGTIKKNRIMQTKCNSFDLFSKKISLESIFANVTGTDFEFSENIIENNSMCYVLVKIESDAVESLITNNSLNDNIINKTLLDVTAKNPVIVRNNILQNNKASAFGWETEAVLLKGTKGIQITGNVLNNPGLKYEMRNDLLTFNESEKTNATLNYWGFKMAKEISQRILDGSLKITASVVQYSPFYLNPDRTTTTSDQFQVNVLRNGSKLGGRMSRSITLGNRHESYIIESDLIIHEGVKLSILDGVTVLIRPNVNILVYGQLEVRGTELRPVKFDTASAVQHAQYNRLRLSPGNAAASKNEGILEIQLNGTWYTLCEREWTSDNTRTACRQLGLGSRKLNNIHVYLNKNQMQ